MLQNTKRDDMLELEVRGTSSPMASDMQDQFTPDEDWVYTYSRAVHTHRDSGHTLPSWIESVRTARSAGSRVFVGMHLFAGKRRAGDIEWWVQKLGIAIGLIILSVSVDLDSDSAWDLLCPDTFAVLMDLAEGGFIDFIGGGPPCGTFSIARFRKMLGGPRPVRFRGAMAWGRPDLSNLEKVCFSSKCSLTPYDRVVRCRVQSGRGSFYRAPRGSWV